jgi:hypothetical protein
MYSVFLPMLTVAGDVKPAFRTLDEILEAISAFLSV